MASGDGGGALHFSAGQTGRGANLTDAFASAHETHSPLSASPSEIWWCNRADQDSKGYSAFEAIADGNRNIRVYPSPPVFTLHPPCIDSRIGFGLYTSTNRKAHETCGNYPFLFRIILLCACKLAAMNRIVRFRTDRRGLEGGRNSDGGRSSTQSYRLRVRCGCSLKALMWRL
jgi:hypothetical protein